MAVGIVEHACMIARIMAVTLLLLTCFMPWASLETAGVHVRYTASNVRVCAGGEFCKTVDWKYADKLNLACRDVAELATNVTHLDAAARTSATKHILSLSLPRHPVDIVAITAPSVLPTIASLVFPVRWTRVSNAMAGLAAALMAVAVVASSVQLAPYASHIGVGMAIAVVAAMLNSAAAALVWFT